MRFVTTYENSSNSMLSKINRSLVILFLSLVVASCAGLNGQMMVPVFDDKTPIKTNKSISRIEVRGEKEEIFSGPTYAKKDQIHYAARETLKRMAIFNSVDEGKGDLTMHIIVRSQTQNSSLLLEYRASITITYRLVNIGGDVIWSKTFETEFSDHSFSGATRTVKAREGSVRENLALLAESLGKGLNN